MTRMQDEPDDKDDEYERQLRAIEILPTWSWGESSNPSVTLTAWQSVLRKVMYREQQRTMNRMFGIDPDTTLDEYTDQHPVMTEEELQEQLKQARLMNSAVTIRQMEEHMRNTMTRRRRCTFTLRRLQTLPTTDPLERHRTMMLTLSFLSNWWDSYDRAEEEIATKPRHQLTSDAFIYAPTHEFPTEEELNEACRNPS
jgi:hypothetical protein